MLASVLKQGKCVCSEGWDYFVIG